jgi:hypothetical protein
MGLATGTQNLKLETRRAMPRRTANCGSFNHHKGLMSVPLTILDSAFPVVVAFRVSNFQFRPAHPRIEIEDSWLI